MAYSWAGTDKWNRCDGCLPQGEKWTLWLANFGRSLFLSSKPRLDYHEKRSPFKPRLEEFGGMVHCQTTISAQDLPRFESV